MRILLALLLLLTGVAVADAGCPTVRRVTYYRSAVVYKPVPVIAQVLVPAYGGSYAPQQQRTDDDLIRRLVEVLERMEGRLNEPPGGFKVDQVMQVACASCHTEGQKPRGDFILFNADGSPAELSVGDRKLVKLRVETTDEKFRMPPEKALSPLAIQALVNGLR